MKEPDIIKKKEFIGYQGSHLGHHDHLIHLEVAQFHILNGGSKGHADEIAEKVFEALKRDK